VKRGGKQTTDTNAESIPSGRLTMADLAKLAGVSKITVSRAMADSTLVNPQTRSRVRELARQHGYALNVTARNLRLRRSHTIAVIVEMAPSPERPMSGPYPLELLGGISQELTSAGYSVLLSARHGAITPATQAADGVILLGQGAHEDAVHTVEGWRMPTVIWGADMGAGHVVVGSDNRQAGASVAEYFIAAGRRRPCFIGDLDHAENAERFAGFRNALAAKGITPSHIDGVGFTADAAAKAVVALLARKSFDADAVFAVSDLLAMGAIQALSGHGIRVPEAVSVVGYDDTPMGASFVPSLSSVHQDLYQGGILLARKVLALIDGKQVSSEYLPTRLVTRGT
jgi:DNA-binding LacI/PurR family transcriptional regulator